MIYHYSHNCETGEFTVYSLHDQKVKADLTALNLTESAGLEMAQLLSDAIRRIEKAAYIAGRKQTINAMTELCDKLWDQAGRQG